MQHQTFLLPCLQKIYFSFISKTVVLVQYLVGIKMSASALPQKVMHFYSNPTHFWKLQGVKMLAWQKTCRKYTHMTLKKNMKLQAEFF